MNSRDIYINFFRFIFLVLLQALLLNRIDLLGHVNPYLYILFIVLLPFETPRWLLLVSAFLLGFCIDIFMKTMGMNMAATVFIAWMRPGLVTALSRNRDIEPGMKPGIRDFGFRWFFVYSGVLVLVHHILVFLLEAFKLSNFFSTMKNALLSAALTLLLIIISQYLFGRGKK